VVVSEDRMMKWRVIIKEKNGIGLKVESCIRVYYFNFKQQRIFDKPKLENAATNSLSPRSMRRLRYIGNTCGMFSKDIKT